MAFADSLLQKLFEFLPLVMTLVGVIGLLWVAHIFLIKRNEDQGNEKQFSNQLIMLGLTIAGLLAVILSLPVSDSTRNQIIGFVGLVISGVFAFSSSTIFANLLAGIMMRITKPFKTGDFIRVGDNFGRVVDRGLLDTEIQTEVSNLVALPNTFMITNPISVTRSSGTIISTTLSLGFDVHHSTVEELLTQATEQSGLTDGFVHIAELGNFSVVYKVSGKLEEVKNLISAKSRLNRAVLDVLHDNQIEIMSPNFMSTRQVPDGNKMIPTTQRVEEEVIKTTIEEVVFDKADAAEKHEVEKGELVEEIKALEEKLSLESEDSKKKMLKAKIEAAQLILKTLKEEKNGKDSQE